LNTRICLCDFLLHPLGNSLGFAQPGLLAALLFVRGPIVLRHPWPQKKALLEREHALIGLCA